MQSFALFGSHLWYRMSGGYREGATFCEEKHRICWSMDLLLGSFSLWWIRIIDVSKKNMKKNSRTEIYHHSKEMREENSGFPKVSQICLWYSCVVLMLSLFLKTLNICFYLFIFSAKLTFQFQLLFAKPILISQG